MTTSEFIANLGDSSPLEYGGYFLYRQENGDFEAEKLDEPTECELDDPEARWTVRRVCLDRCKLQRSEDGASVYLVSFKYDPATYSHPLPQYEAWFAKHLSAVASYIGSTREALEEQLCSADGRERALAYQAIADTEGWDNFDSYPLELSLEEVEIRYVKGELGEGYYPADAVALKAEYLRPAMYSARKVHCPNAGAYGAGAGFGDLICFTYPSSPGDHIARVLARVDARSDGPEVKACIAWLAIVEIILPSGSAMVRWIDPAWVTACGSVPKDMLAWFFQEKLPGLPAVFKLNGLGALSNHYIGKYTGECERCIVEHGIFGGRPCTHEDVELPGSDE
jgi:hypothetical protein